MQEVLLLFSGGKDSFLTACREIHEHNRVTLISFNNSAVLGEKNFLHGATRLINRWGSDQVKYAGVYNTGAVIQNLVQYWKETPQREIADAYPDLTYTQVTCLHCQTAMWICAIAYARAHNIQTIASGYRKSDPFCTGDPGYIERIRSIAAAHKITIKLPAWEDESWSGPAGDFNRDTELYHNKFLPAVYEPKCMLGWPVANLNQNEKASMHQYFDNILSHKIDTEILRMTEVFSTIDLGPVSIDVLDYPIPDPREDGLY